MRVLVTGGAGFIGSNLVDFLLENDHKVVVIDDLSSGDKSNLKQSLKKINFIKSKVEDINLSNLKKIDAVVHLAAQASVPLSISDFKSSSKTNILSTLSILNYCHINKLPLVYASSSAVYGDLKIGNDENEDINLLSPYAADKYLMEIYSKVLFNLSGLSTIGLRFFNVYGPRQDPKSPYSGVISIFLDRIIENNYIKINGGSQTRDFVFVKDVVLAIYKSIQITKSKKVNDKINILSGKTTSIDKLSDIIYKKLDRQAKKKFKPMIKGDPMKSDGTTKKMKKILNLKPSSMVSIEEGLSRTIDHIKKT
jgi:UDP-glucose 4-epimerase